jgi:hypothetical protein
VLVALVSPDTSYFMSSPCCRPGGCRRADPGHVR